MQHCRCRIDAHECEMAAGLLRYAEQVHVPADISTAWGSCWHAMLQRQMDCCGRGKSLGEHAWESGAAHGSEGEQSCRRTRRALLAAPWPSTSLASGRCANGSLQQTQHTELTDDVCWQRSRPMCCWAGMTRQQSLQMLDWRPCCTITPISLRLSPGAGCCTTVLHNSAA